MNIYQYLQSTGVLEHGTVEQIEAARKEYTKFRKAEWRKAHRKTIKTISVDFIPTIYRIIERTAKKHKTNPTAFVHGATIAAINQHKLHFNDAVIGEIREALMMNYYRLNNLVDDGIVQPGLVQPIIQHIATLERLVVDTLNSPKTIEESLKSAIQINPESKMQFLHFINSL